MRVRVRLDLVFVKGWPNVANHSPRPLETRDSLLSLYATMECDPKTMLEWLAMPGDLQMVALEQLSMMLLLSDNVDRVFER